MPDIGIAPAPALKLPPDRFARQRWLSPLMVRVLLVNLSNVPFEVQDGERIAQLVVARHEVVEWQPTEALSETERGTGGYGSTGVN